MRGNHVHGTRDGVYVSFGSDALVDGNHITDTRYAVHTMFATDLVLVENTFESNRSGAVLMYGGPVLALRNTATGSHSPATGFGVLLKDVVGAELVENVVADNRVGVHLDGPAGAAEADRTLVRANTVARNAVGVALYASASGRFSANSFVANHVQVASAGGRLVGRSDWTDAGVGNYWSTYRGYEAEPGRGALPHREGGSVDLLLTRSPVLVALADSPGLRLLRALEERWTQSDAVLVDDLPLSRPLSPAEPPRHPLTPATRAAVGGGALALLTALALALLWLRTPRPAPTEVPA